MMTAVRCLVSWVLAEAWLALTIVATLALAFGNFVVAWQSFEAQGFEPVPLQSIPFLGLVTGAIGLGGFPIAALYALVLTVAMNVAVITAAKILARMIQLYFDYRGVLHSQDPAVQERAADYLDLLLKIACWFLLILVPTILIILFDVKQFRLRYEGLVQDLRDPVEMLHWAPEPVARLGHFLAGFIRTATWGYLGCVVGMALVLEYAFVRAAERWEVLGNAVQEAIQGEELPAEQPELRRTATEAEPAPVVHRVPAPAPVESGPGSDGTGRSVRTGSPSPDPVAPPEPPLPPPVTAPPSTGPEIEVIVGPGQIRRISVAELEADPDQFVQDGSGRAWFTRNYYEEVMGLKPEEDR